MMVFALRAAAILGAIGVAAGAFGAHALRDSLSEARLATFETAVRYLLLHVPALLAVGFLARDQESKWLDCAGMGFLFGIVLFSGSLFALVLLERPILGAVTPFGGVLLIASWLSLGVAAGRARTR
jgi:uncharacterized membrane protein YgdD (TMEM256/DUF423 family)